MSKFIASRVFAGLAVSAARVGCMVMLMERNSGVADLATF